MTEFAIGDIQGCYDRLRRVLDCVRFDPARDRLWVAGDLVNRGPESLKTLRFLRALGSSAQILLGNHDLHLLAVGLGQRKPKRKDTLQEVLDAADCGELLQWLRQGRLAHYDAQRQLFMAHAGLPHIWPLTQALALAAEVEAVLRSEQIHAYLEAMYGNEPDCWSDDLQGVTRWRVITNYFTRMRFIAEDGRLDFTVKETLDLAPKGMRPWFAWPRPDQLRVLFGHWAALEGQTGSERFIGLDTGCVWGGKLTLMNLDTDERIHCDC